MLQDSVLAATSTAFKNDQYTALPFHFNNKVVATWSARYLCSVASEIIKLTFVLFETSKYSYRNSVRIEVKIVYVIRVGKFLLFLYLEGYVLPEFYNVSHEAGC
jgi:hypothetical protein